mmetsp:Transcript_34390/g.97420  ORF Transcript_34390/g.97420 Transcript_34390/m.97420 type:complete len:263 (+) Transcript_34390:158-946(+)
MFKAVTRAARPAAAGTAAAATAASSNPPSSAPVARAEALRATSLLSPPEVNLEELTVFSGKNNEAKTTSWNLVDVFGEEITIEDVHEAVDPMIEMVHSPASSETSSDGMVADCLIQQADSIMKSVQAMANDRDLQMAVMNHPAFLELLPTLRQGNSLLPPAAAIAVTASTVTVEEINGNEGKNVLELLSKGLKAVGDRLAGAFRGAGDFFRGIAAKVTGNQDAAANDGDKEDAGWQGQVFTLVFGLVCVVLLSVIAKRAVAR